MNDDAFKLQTLERAVYMDGWMDGCVCVVCLCVNARMRLLSIATIKQLKLRSKS